MNPAARLLRSRRTKTLRQQRFAAPVIATSARFGRGLALSQQAASRFGVCALLPKPFKREELIKGVKAALGAAGNNP
jgi:CheY-like chemotaxis protein